MAYTSNYAIKYLEEEFKRKAQEAAQKAAQQQEKAKQQKSIQSAAQASYQQSKTGKSTKPSQSNARGNSTNSSTISEKSSYGDVGASQSTRYKATDYRPRSTVGKRTLDSNSSVSSLRRRTDARLDEANERLALGTRRSEADSFSGRASKVTHGSAKQFIGAQVSSVGTAMQKWDTDEKSILEGEYIGGKKGQKKYSTRRGDRLTESQAKKKAEDTSESNGSRRQGVSIKDFERVYDADPNSLSQKLINAGDTLQESGGRDVEQAKEGLGKIGTVAVDLSSNAMMMAGDGLLNLIAPGAGLASLANRAGGMASFEGRQEGMNADQQYMYALTTSAIEAASEQIGNGVSAFRGIYGKGAIDLADSASTRVASSKIVQRLFRDNPVGRNLASELARLGVNMGEEGFEEVVADVFEPAMKYAITKSTGGQYDPTSVQEMAYDFMIGALMAFGGGGAFDTTRNVISAVNGSPAMMDGAATAESMMAIKAANSQNEGTTAKYMAEAAQSQLDSGGIITESQINRMKQATAESIYNNEMSRRERQEETLSNAYEKGEVEDYKYEGTLASNYEKQGYNTARGQAYQETYDKVAKAMGVLDTSDPATSGAVSAVANVMDGVADTLDIDTVISSNMARSAYESLTGEKLPVNNAKAREALETQATINSIATHNASLQMTWANDSSINRELSANLKSNGQTVFTENASQGEEAVGKKLYAQVFDKIYAAGTVSTLSVNDAMDMVNTVFADSEKGKAFFTKARVNEIFLAGRADTPDIRTNGNPLKSGRKAAVGKGEFVVDKDAESKLAPRVRKALEKLAENGGIPIHVVSSIENTSENAEAHVNGKYEDGVIYIAVDASNPLVTVAKHELTHWIKDNNLDAYKKLEDFVFERWYHSDPDEMQARIDKYSALYKGLSLQEVKEEIIADASEAFFTDEGAISDVIEYNRNLGKTIKAGIHRLLNGFTELRRAQKGVMDRGYGNFLKDMDILVEAESMWADALEGAMEGKGEAKPLYISNNEMNANLHEVHDMKPVGTVEFNTELEVTNNIDTNVNTAFNYLKSNEALSHYREDVGSVVIDEKGLEDVFKHNRKDLSMSTLDAIPYVLKSGEIVAADINHKGKKYNTITIVAPIKYTGKGHGKYDTAGIYYTGVVLKRTHRGSEIGQKLHVTDVLTVRKDLSNSGASTKVVRHSDGTDLNLRHILEYVASDVNIFEASDEKKLYSLTTTESQQFTSADTSINSSKVPAVFNKVNWKSGTVNVDIGGGRFDTAQEFLKPKGVENLVYDPYNRSKEHNKRISDRLDKKKADTATISNVLNVIQEKSARFEVLNNARENVKPGGEVYITVYEGNGSGIGAETSKGYQLNMKLKDYLSEVQEVFPNAYIRKGMIVAPNPEVNSKTGKLSMTAPVEETKELLAVHNLKASDLMGALKLGGFPMPSIAVIKAEAGHNDYGEFSAVFDKKTIDPSASTRNMVYGGDAWTPTFPQIQYKPNNKVQKRISDYYYENSKKFGYDTMRPMYGLASQLEDELNRAGGEEALKDRYKNDTSAMRMYLKMNGQDVKDVIKRTETTLTDAEIEMRQAFIDSLGEDAIREFEGKDVPNGQSKLDHRKGWIKDHISEVREAYAEYIRSIPLGLTEEEIKSELDNTSVMKLTTFVRDAMNYLNNGKSTVKEETDYKATNEAVEKAAKKAGYDQWVDNLLDGVSEKEGIRNNTDFFTRTGNRRSWDALHDEVSLVNIVRAMASQDNGETFLGSSLKANAQKKYRNLSEIRQDKGRLRKVSEEEYKTLMEGFAQRESEILYRIAEASPTYETNPFIKNDTIRSTIVDDVRKGLSREAFLKDLKKWGATKGATMKDVEDILALVKDVSEMPTGYFEAKPKRPVTFDEVKALLAPSDADPELIRQLEDAGLTVVQYEAGNDADRTAKLNQAADEKGLKFSMTVKEANDLSKSGTQMDFFDMMKKMGADDKNARIGSKAMAATAKLKGGNAWDNNYTTVARGFFTELIQDGNASIVGHTIRNQEDLAKLLQIYRDPRYETSRMFFANQDGEIVFQTGVTSKMPAVSKVFDGDKTEDQYRYLNKILDIAHDKGATTMYISHNHPSGDPNPSRADFGVTRTISNWLGESKVPMGFGGSIVIDHNKYAFIGPAETEMNYSRDSSRVHEMPEYIDDPYLGRYEKPDPLRNRDYRDAAKGIGKDITSADAIALYSKQVGAPKGKVTLFYADAKLKGQGIQTVPLSYLETVTEKQFVAEVKEYARDFGSTNLFMSFSYNDASDKVKNMMLKLYEDKFATDIVAFRGNGEYIGYNGYFQRGRSKANDFFGEKASKQSYQVGEEVRFSLSQDNENGKIKYTKKQYNDFGWAFGNGVLSRNEYSSWNEQLIHLRSHNQAYDGSYIVPVGDKWHVGNTLVYTKGTKQNPIITKIVKMNVDVYADYDMDTYLSDIRETIYEKEKSNRNAMQIIKGYFPEEFFTEYRGEDFPSHEEYSRGTERNGSQKTIRFDEDNDGRGTAEESVERYQLTEDSTPAIQGAQSTIAKLENRVASLKAEFRRTDLKTPKQDQARIQAGKLIKRHGSNLAIQSHVVDTFNQLFAMYKTDGIGTEEAYNLAYQQALEIVDNISVIHDEGKAEHDAIRKYLKDTKIIVSPEMKKNITDYDAFRKRYGFKMNLKNGDITNIDSVYMELQELFPGRFPEDLTNTAEMLYAMADVLDEQGYFYEQYDASAPEMQDYVVSVAADLMETAFDLQTKKTFADRKYEEKVRAVEKEREKALATREKQKERYEKELQDLKEHQKEMKEKARARKAESEAKSKLLRIARRLNNLKTTAATRAQIDELIGDLDLVAKGMTGQTLEKLTSLREWYEDQNANNPDFIADSNIEEKLARLSRKHIKDMTLEEVQDLYDVLSNIENEIRTSKKLIDSEIKKEIKEAGLQTMANINRSKGVSTKLRDVDSFFINGTLSPVRQIRRVTGYVDNDPLYIATKELADGQRKMLTYQMEAWKSFDKFMTDKAFLKRLNGSKAEEIEVTGYVNGEPYTTKITPDIRMEMYLSSLNEDNLRHIRDGGITLPDIKLYKKGKISDAVQSGVTVKFSPSQLKEITSHMTKEEKAFAQKAYEYFNETSHKAINEVSEALKGYSIAKVKNYYPIRTDQDFLSKDFEAMKFDGTIEGMGFLKERVRAYNPVVMTGLVDTLTRSIDMNSKFVGLAIPVRNFNKLYGVNDIAYTEKYENGVKRVESDFRGSVKKSIANKWGEPVSDYIGKFMTDIQNGRKNSDDWEKVFNKMRSHYAGAVLTMNASVAVKQAASYPTAAAVLGWTPLARAMEDFGKVDLDLIARYTPLQWYRSQGFSTTELGDIKAGNSRSILEEIPALNWIQGMDVLTTRKLWKASEYYVQQHNKRLEVGSEDYYKAVADIYNRVIEETQPNYTAMQRPGLLRSDSALVQTLNMFKTQPYQNFNILYDAIGNYSAKRKQNNTLKTNESQKALKEASKDLYNAATSQVAQLAVFAAMTSLWALFRRKDDRYRDEDGNLTFLSYLEQLSKDMLANSFAVVPFGSDIYSVASSIVTGDTYYGFTSVTDSAIADVLDSLKNGATTIGSWIEYYNDEDPDKKPSVDLYRNTESVISSVSRAMGIPASNLRNLVNGMYGWVAIAADGEYIGTYKAQKMTFAKDADKYDNLFRAYRNDKKAYTELRNMMIEDGMDESKIDSAMNTRKKADKSEAEQKKYDASMDRLEKSDIWKDASDEDKDKYSKILEKVAVGISDSQTESVTKSGLTQEQVILYKLALKKVDTPNVNGNMGTYTKAEKEEALKLLMKEYNLTDAQKEALMG